MRQVTHALLTRPPLSHKIFISEENQIECFVRLACVKHAASVHPEPGSNSHKKFSSSSRISLAILSLFYCFLGWCFRIRSLNSFSKTSGTLFFRSWTIPKCSRIPAFSSAATREQAPVCLPLKPPALRAWKSVFMNFQGCFTVQLSMFFVVLFSTACLVYQNFSGLSRTFFNFFISFSRFAVSDRGDFHILSLQSAFVNSIFLNYLNFLFCFKNFVNLSNVLYRILQIAHADHADSIDSLCRF